MNKNSIKYVIIAILIGTILGKYVFNQYKNESMKAMAINENYVYMLQYGVYIDENNMKENTKNLKNFFYYSMNDGFHVIIGITKKPELKEKIINAYDIKNDIYLKKIEVNNDEFIKLLDQYDNLISKTNDNDVITASQKQILSKYQEIILENE